MVERINISTDKDLKLVKNGLQSVIVSFPLFRDDVLLPFNNKNEDVNCLNNYRAVINTAIEALDDGGLLFIYGSPIQLIKSYELLPSNMKFRYWIAIDLANTFEANSANSLKHSHLAGVLMLSKGNNFLPIDTKNTRIKYLACSHCSKNIKDWGGKKHLMNLKGTGVSDVWKDFFHVKKTILDKETNFKLNCIDYSKLSFSFDHTKIPEPVLDRILNLLNKKKTLLIECSDKFIKLTNKIVSLPNAVNIVVKTNSLENKVEQGDCIAYMKSLAKQFPDGVFDLVFADPPYNLDKEYKSYEDGLSDQHYVEWCNNWLELCVRLTKPTGNILILNIPKWSLEHSKCLNDHAFLQNWIVWDALSTPKGKIMPAHYTLLSYSKLPSGHTFNKLEDVDSPEYCLRASCIKQRKRLRDDNKVPISDVWSDVHRIKHKKDRDDHPCQLPEKFMDRIIKMYSNEGDLVFDPFCGAGTTAIAALRNKRKYLTVELDKSYIDITKEKLNQIASNGEYVRSPKPEKVRCIYTKKDLELKAQLYAQELGRKPTMEEFISKFSIKIDELHKLYKDPKMVLKAARIAMLNGVKLEKSKDKQLLLL